MLKSTKLIATIAAGVSSGTLLASFAFAQSNSFWGGGAANVGVGAGGGGGTGMDPAGGGPGVSGGTPFGRWHMSFGTTGPATVATPTTGVAATGRQGDASGRH